MTAANTHGLLSRKGGAPHIELTSTAETLCAWLRWCDPNGTFFTRAERTAERKRRRAHGEELSGDWLDCEPFNRTDAWEAIADMLANDEGEPSSVAAACRELAQPTQYEILQGIAARFPATFGLRGFPGETFRVSVDASYFPALDVRDESRAILYLARDTGDGWACFAKGTEAEIRRELTAAPSKGGAL